MAYKKIDTGFKQSEQVKLVEVGDTFEGTLVKIREVETPDGLSPTANIADFIGLDGKDYSMFLPAQLTMIFDANNPDGSAYIGERLKITYTGKIKAKRGRMNAFDVEVWEDESPSKK